jgi:hypothetical protein
MQNDPKKKIVPGSSGKIPTKIYSYVLIGLAAAVMLYLLASSYGLFSARTKITESVMSSINLYTAKESRQKIALFFGDPLAEGFKEGSAEIYQSEQQINRIKQALLILLQGPSAKGYINLIPEGTQLREAYLDTNNFLFIDLSSEMSTNCKGGTTGEYEAVYSIINSVFSNFPWVKGVKLLINGEEKDSLAGHISLKDFLKADMAGTSKPR